MRARVKGQNSMVERRLLKPGSWIVGRVSRGLRASCPKSLASVVGRLQAVDGRWGPYLLSGVYRLQSTRLCLVLSARTGERQTAGGRWRPHLRLLSTVCRARSTVFCLLLSARTGERQTAGGRRRPHLRLLSTVCRLLSTVLLLSAFWLLPSAWCAPRAHRVSSAAGLDPLPVNPPDTNMILPAVYDPENGALRVEAGTLAGNPGPSNADQVMGAVYDSSNSALRIECLNNCGVTLPNLETNGLTNGSQTVLNLQNGTDISLNSQTGSGTVTFNFTGVLPQNQAGQSNQFLTGYNATTGAFSFAQPIFNNISGTVGASQIAPSPVTGDCPQYNGTAMIWFACGASLTNWNQNSTTGTVAAQPISGEDTPILQLQQNVSNGSADMVQVYKAGGSPTSNCSTNPYCIWSIGPSGMYMAANDFTLGAANQSSASFLSLFGGTPGQAYVELSSAALNSPVAPVLSTAATGGSLPASTSYPAELTYVNGAGETPAGPSASITTASGTSTNTVSVNSPAAETNATGYNVYVRASGGNWYLQNSSPVAFGTNFTMTSMNTNSVQVPSANTTAGLYTSFLSMSAEGNGVLCTSTSVPGQDCTSGTTLVTQASGTPAAGDCVKWTGPNQIGDQGAACGSGTGGASSWSGLTNPSGNLSLGSMGSYSSTWTWSNGNQMVWSGTGTQTLQTTTTATPSGNQNSPALTLAGAVYSGGSVSDPWTIQDAPSATGTGWDTLSFLYGGPDTNVAIYTNTSFQSYSLSGFSGAANFVASRAAGTTADYLNFSQNGTTTFRVDTNSDLIFGNTAAHIKTNQASSDIAGTIAISAATSGSHGFITNYGSAPVCTVSPTSNPGSVTWWVTTSTSSVTVSLSASSTITFNYICIGNPG
jgi:hypothetical protein